MDAGKVSDLISKLRDLSATGFADAAIPISTIQITVTSNDGKRIENVSIAKYGFDYLAQRKGEPTLYKLSASAVDDLLKASDAI